MSFRFVWIALVLSVPIGAAAQEAFPVAVPTQLVAIPAPLSPPEPPTPTLAVFPLPEHRPPMPVPTVAWKAPWLPPFGARSPGCGLAPPEVVPAGFAFAGQQRGLILAVPPDYDPGRPHNLVLAFHGRTSSNAQVRRYYDLEEHATQPTIFAYPAGLALGDGRYSWGSRNTGEAEDFELFDKLVRTIGTAYCVDLARVFVVGHSLGGSYVNGLACTRADSIRAVASLGGGGGRSRNCGGAVAALIMHNPDDEHVPVAQAVAVRDAIRVRNHLGTSEVVAAEPKRFNCERYGKPGAIRPLLWCAHGFDHTGSGRWYPHTWPDGTGAAMMAFFEGLP